MGHPLDGVRIKIERARVHLESIDSAVRDYTERQFREGVLSSGPVQLDPFDQRWQQFKWRGVPPMDRMVGAMLGDFVHNLRSALDHAAWAIVKVSGAEPGHWTHFPTAESEGKCRDDVTERDPKRGNPPTLGLSERCFDLVYRFQPLHLARKERGRAPLPRIVQIDNADKHRLLYGAAAYVSGESVILRVEPAGFVDFQRVRLPRPGTWIEDGADLAKVRIRVIALPPEGTQMHVKFDIPAHVAFVGDGEFIANHSDLAPMLAEVERFYGDAMLL
jgi:hypothetical protein